FFFFQAEDGIRDFHVTGVQTCALPILRPNALDGVEHFGGRRGVALNGNQCPELIVDLRQRGPAAGILAHLERLRRGRAAAAGSEIGRASCRERVWSAVGAVSCEEGAVW